VSKRVIIDGPYKDAAKRGRISSNSYNDLTIHALPGLHDYVASLVQMHVPVGGSIIDLASGSGAMCARLTDMGYKLTAVDYVEENFKSHGDVPFYKVDLNGEFQTEIKQKFNCVLAMEIIEHLENPRAFIRSITNLLEDDGVIVLTTPNISCPASKVQFIKTGTFEWFDDEKYTSEGHITPVSPWLISKIFSENKIAPVCQGSFDQPNRSIKDWLKFKFLTKFIGAISSQTRQEKGEIFSIVGKRDSK